MKRRHKIRSSILAAPMGFWGSPAASLLFIFLSFVLLLFSLHQSSMIGALRVNAQDILAPVLKTAYAPVHSAASFVRDVSGIASLQAENAALQLENEKLRQWYHRAMVLNHENQSLRALLNMPLPDQSASISARVVLDTSSPFVKSLLIDAGTENGLSGTRAVLSDDGLVGRTIDVGEKMSRVLLITDISSRIPVMIEGSGEQAVLAGNNDHLPELKYISEQHQIVPGARVVTSGQGGVFPSGLPVGRVVAGPVGGSAKLNVALYADLNALHFVRVVDAPQNAYFIQAN